MHQDIRMAVGDVIGELEAVAFLVGQYAQRGRDNALVLELCEELAYALGLDVQLPSVPAGGEQA